MANLLGRLQTLLFGAAIGRAASDSIGPVLEPVRQEAWKENQNRVLDPQTAAAAIAQGLIAEGEGQEEAARSGVSSNRLGVLWRLAQTVPGIAELRALRRRSAGSGGARQITVEQLHHGYARHGIDPQYWSALDALVLELIPPVALAQAIHRGLVADPGLLAVEPPAREGKVKAYPVYPIDALAEALGSGVDRDRLGVLVGLAGNPMGPHEAAQALFRGILEESDYERAIAEGNTRNEWGDAIREQTRQIPTARDFVENALRGYRDLASALEGAALHGMSPEHATLIYQNQGRPMAVRLITQALARGGTFKPEPGELTDPYEASIVEGNLKPAYYDLAHALRYTNPSVFAIRQLAQAGIWDAAEATKRLEWLGWSPADAAQVGKAWAATASGGAGKQETAAELRAEYEGYLLTEGELRQMLGALGYAPAEVDREVHLGDAARVKSYRDKALEAVHKAYVSAQLTSAEAAAYMEQLAIDPAARTNIVAIWDLEKQATRKTLTQAQIRAAYRRNAITQAEAIADLEEHGLSAADAQAYLAS